MDVYGPTAAATTWAVRTYAGPAQAATTASQEAPESKDQRGIEDTVEISREGRLASLLAGGAESLLGIDAGADGAISLDEMTTRLEEITADLQTTLGNRFRAAGIDTSQPIDLEVDATGAVRVANDHPDKDKIEAMFADDPDLANAFRGVLALQETVSAAERHLAFAEAYAEDPEAAVAQFGIGSSQAAESEILLRFIDGQLTAVE